MSDVRAEAAFAAGVVLGAADRGGWYADRLIRTDVQIIAKATEWRGRRLTPIEQGAAVGGYRSERFSRGKAAPAEAPA